MKKIVFFIFILIFAIGCKKEDKNAKAKPQTRTEKPILPYSKFVKILSKKSENEKKNFFFHYIDVDVPNYWEGTPWSFNGNSSIPRQGSVACGYFITNILMNYGFKIKGNYLAQQASSVMIKQLCTDVKHFSKREDLEKYLLSKDKNQVYIVGLDFHTGFLTREINDTYFIHSNYIRNQGPVKEKTSESRALNISKSFMVGNLKF